METYTLQLGDIIVREVKNVKQFIEITYVNGKRAYSNELVFFRNVPLNPNDTDHYLTEFGKPIYNKYFPGKYRLLRCKSEYIN